MSFRAASVLQYAVPAFEKINTAAYWDYQRTRNNALPGKSTSNPLGGRFIVSHARRARLGVTGKFGGDWAYTLIYDFGGVADPLDGQVVELLDLQRRRIGDNHKIDRPDLQGPPSPSDSRRRQL